MFSGFETYKLSSDILLVASYADVQEFSFHTAKRSDTGGAILQGVIFEDRQEWRIVVTKHSDKGSTVLQEGRFVNAQGAKRCNMSSAVQQ